MAETASRISVKLSNC